MRSPIKPAFSELQSFLSAYELTTISRNEALQTELRSYFKRYYALLVWNFQIESSKPWSKNISKSEKFQLYFGEATSDICQSLLLSFQGMYKPALLILRSGIENFFRCIGIAYDQNVLSLTSVYELINVVTEINEFKQNQIARRHVEVLQNIYSILCGYVHTADVTHMSMTGVVGVFPRFEQAKSKRFFDISKDVIVSVCSINCITLKQRFNKMHHTHKDVLYDVLPRNVKNFIAS
jgi:hypothetical protein